MSHCMTKDNGWHNIMVTKDNGCHNVWQKIIAGTI